MITRLFCYKSSSFDPYRNLAIEEALLSRASDCAILYLWQNENTVVIGRNQNAFKECKTALLERDGGYLARRLSGGGAVFHDLGNLNFTILLPQSDFDIARQLTVVESALASLGIPVERSGRNDILASGKKFSGNAFYKNGKTAYHHGTLLIAADLERLNRYLSPSKLKLQSKGVDSVRSRVANLQEFMPNLTISMVEEALKVAFSKVYDLPLQTLAELDLTAVDALTQRNCQRVWNYGSQRPFSCALEGRFPWGCAEVALEVVGGKVTNAKVFTDAMELGWVEPLAQALMGCSFDATALTDAAKAFPDISSLFSQI